MQKHVEQINEEEQEHVKGVSLCMTQNNITDLVSQVNDVLSIAIVYNGL